MDGDADADDDPVWRCKACGTRQPDPEPPCERCWNATFVSGEGAAEAVDAPDPSLLDADSLQVARVRATAGRSGFTAAALAGLLGALVVLLPSGAVSELAFALFGGVAAVAAVLFAVAAGAAVAAR